MTTKRRRERPHHAKNLGQAAAVVDAEEEAREVARSLAQSKQAALQVLCDAVNRLKPARAPMIRPDCLTEADVPGELCWEAAGWTAHFFLEAFDPIGICWGSPDEAIFKISPTGRRSYAPSIDDPRQAGWPKT